MKKTAKRAVLILLCAALIISVASCEKPEDKGAIADVWSIANTEKILADREYDDSVKQSKNIRISMAKGEFESGQLLISAKRDISSIQLRTADLKSGENTLPADNIKVYFQKYLNIESMSSPKAPIDIGKWPDALVPLANIQDKNEDKAKANENQGLWITVKTPYDCAAGTYSAIFELSLDGNIINVPISVKVWDFEMPRTGHQKTTFNNFREDLIGGELDNTPEMMEVYYDYFLDYKISLYELPMLDGTAETFVKQAKKYAADDRCNAYNMEYQYLPNTLVTDNGVSKVIFETNWDNIKERMLLLAKESRPGMNLFEKLYFWDQSTDEPDGGVDRIFEANYKQRRFNSLLGEVVAELGQFDYAAHGITKQDILYVENVVTAQYASKIPDITSYCPMINSFDTAEKREVYDRLKEEDPRKTVWWYDAWIPQYPYPNYRVEESSLGSRVMGWMQKDYDIAGLLYWGTSVYVKQGNPGGPMPRDPYVDPYSFQAISMDGCLTYPGRNYGITGPVGSIRLDSIRDGLEDYEYLWLLEDLLKKAQSEYGVTFDYDKIMRNIFDSLYTDVIPNKNGDNLFKARQEVAEMIELLSSDVRGAIMIDKIDVMANKAHISVYAGEGTSVKVGDVSLQGQPSADGLKFTYVKDLSEAQNFVPFVFEKGGLKITVMKNAGKKSYAMPMFDGSTVVATASNGHASDPKEHIVIGENDDNNEVDADYLRVAIGKYQTDNEIAQIVYNPEIYLSKDKFFAGAAPSQMDKIKLNVYNASDKNKKMSLKLYFGVSETTIREFILLPGENSIEINQVYLNNWQFLGKADKIALSFEKSVWKVPDIYYIGDAYYTLAD